MHLNAIAAVLSNLGCSQQDEIFPVGSAINQASLTIAIHLTAFGEKTFANVPQEMMNVVDGQHGRRGVVYCGRQRFAGDVHQYAKREQWILFRSALSADRY